MRIFIMAAALLAPTVAAALDAPAPNPSAAERVRLTGSPTPVALAVGRERELVLPQPVVQVGVLPPTRPDQIRITYVTDDTRVLVRPSTPLDGARLAVVTAGGTHLLDLTATEDAPPRGPLVLLAPRPQDGGAAGATAAEGEEPVDPMQVVQWAAQQLYAPQRLLRPLPGATRRRIEAEPLQLSYHPERLQTVPTVAWSVADRFVTAVTVQNLSSRPVTLDPRRFAGRWQMRALVHPRLAAAGDPRGRDRTALILLSPVPFEEAAVWP